MNLGLGSKRKHGKVVDTGNQSLGRKGEETMVDGGGWGEVDLSLGQKRKESEGCWGTTQMRTSRSRFPVLT